MYAVWTFGRGSKEYKLGRSTTSIVATAERFRICRRCGFPDTEAGSCIKKIIQGRKSVPQLFEERARPPQLLDRGDSVVADSPSVSRGGLCPFCDSDTLDTQVISVSHDALFRRAGKMASVMAESSSSSIDVTAGGRALRAAGEIDIALLELQRHLDEVS